MTLAAVVALQSFIAVTAGAVADVVEMTLLLGTTTSTRITTPTINKIIITKTMEERKKKFLSISDIFIALPGGGGTIEEISLVISANQLNLIKNKKMIIYNYKNYWSPLIKQYVKLPLSKYAHKDVFDYFSVCEDIKGLSKIISKIKI